MWSGMAGCYPRRWRRPVAHGAGRATRSLQLRAPSSELNARNHIDSTATTTNQERIVPALVKSMEDEGQRTYVGASEPVFNEAMRTGPSCSTAPDRVVHGGYAFGICV